ncbi:MAG: F0F1 ATP synthase subunit B [Patescibacteria group bacterium]
MSTENETTTEVQNSNPLSSFGVTPTLFMFQLVNFAIIACIIWFLILKPLTKKMAERAKLIDESLDNAKKIQENLQKSEQKYQEKIDAAKAEAGGIIEKAGREAGQMGDEMKVKAKKEIETLIEQAKKNIRSERDEMVADVRKAGADLVVAALEKILTEKIDDKKDRSLIEEMIKKI